MAPKKRLFLQIWNGIKWFLVLDSWFAIAMVLISGWAARETRPAEWQGTMVAAGVLGVLSLLLLYSVFRTRRKLRVGQPEADSSPTHSAFYRFAPRFCRAIAGGSILGCGSQFLTEYDKQPDYSICYVQWFTLFHFPIFPILAIRMKAHERKSILSIPFVLSNQQSTFEGQSYVRLSRRLVRNTYALYYALLLPGIILPLVLIGANWEWVNSIFEGPKFWLVILGYLAWGIGLFALLDKWNHGMLHRKRF